MSEERRCGKLVTIAKEWDSGDMWPVMVGCELPHGHDDECEAAEATRDYLAKKKSPTQSSDASEERKPESDVVCLLDDWQTVVANDREPIFQNHYAWDIIESTLALITSQRQEIERLKRTIDEADQRGDDHMKRAMKAEADLALAVKGLEEIVEGSAEVGAAYSPPGKQTTVRQIYCDGFCDSLFAVRAIATRTLAQIQHKED